MNDALGLPQSILVLGGGSELARAVVARLLAARPASVVLGGRPGSDALAGAAAEAAAAGATSVTTVAFDATDPASLLAAVDDVFDGHGDVDLVLVAFGVLGDQTACESDPLEAVEVATVDYTSAVVAGLAAARRLRRQGHGTLVALSSVAGERVRRANFVYGSAKAGMDGFYQGLTDALVGSGVQVVVVRPGFVTTRMTAGMKPPPLATDAAAVAEAVVAALAKGSGTVWVPGLLRPVFSGLRHLPRPLWRRVPG